MTSLTTKAPDVVAHWSFSRTLASPAKR